MATKGTLILDAERISYKLRRMAYEIWERSIDEKEVVLIGIESGGKILAERLAALLNEISPVKVVSHSIHMNKKAPLNYVLDFEENLDGRTVIIVDDVANSGKTLMYSLHAILSYNIRKIMVAVLVDRKHKSFPIACDIVGHTIATTIKDHIEVTTEGDKITGVYLQ